MWVKKYKPKVVVNTQAIEGLAQGLVFEESIEPPPTSNELGQAMALGKFSITLVIFPTFEGLEESRSVPVKSLAKAPLSSIPKAKVSSPKDFPSIEASPLGYKKPSYQPTKKPMKRKGTSTHLSSSYSSYNLRSLSKEVEDVSLKGGPK